MTRLALMLATVGYCGYAPVASGTVGSAAALLLYAALVAGGWFDVVPMLTLALTGVGIWSASWTATHVGDEDPSIVVIDEVVGMLVTLCFLHVTIVGALIGFLAFRVFDIIKPFPAAQSEALPGGWGIMADDILAGLYAHLLLRGLAWLWPTIVLAS